MRPASVSETHDERRFSSHNERAAPPTMSLVSWQHSSPTSAGRVGRYLAAGAAPLRFVLPGRLRTFVCARTD